MVKQLSDIEHLRAHISELQENGQRLREIADAAVRDQRDMIEAVAGPLRAEIIRLRDALASKSAPGIDASAGCVEPVAWECRTGHGIGWRGDKPPDHLLPFWRPLYAAPQQRQPLGEMEIDAIRAKQGTGIHRRLYVETVRAVEQAHDIGIKETK
jgi:hypothetical protein